MTRKRLLAILASLVVTPFVLLAGLSAPAVAETTKDDVGIQGRLYGITTVNEGFVIIEVWHAGPRVDQVRGAFLRPFVPTCGVKLKLTGTLMGGQAYANTQEAGCSAVGEPYVFWRSFPQSGVFKPGSAMCVQYINAPVPADRSRKACVRLPS